MCNRLCKKLKPLIPFIQLRKNKVYKEFWNTCNYTISQLNSMIQTTQAEFDKIAEIEELRETMETKAFIEYEIAQKIKQLDLDRIDETKFDKDALLIACDVPNISRIDGVDKSAFREILKIDSERDGFVDIKSIQYYYYQYLLYNSIETNHSIEFEALQFALDSRGYNGELPVYEPRKKEN